MMRSVFFLLLATTIASAQFSQPEPPNIPPTEAFTFVVFGDNRGDESGRQPPAFLEVLEAIKAEKPAFALDSGDMIYGHSYDRGTVLEQWRLYRQAVATLQVPIFHVPGNHDIWDAASAQIYSGLWGPTHSAHTWGNSRFIGLDTETVPGVIDDSQFRWLQQELDTCSLSNVFLFCHRPLFPTGPAIGFSLDEYPAKRDRLHKLFVEHRDKIRAVFTGHEHLYHFQERDGIRYYTSGGAGAPLYAPPELGGFHHFLSVHVRGNTAEVRLHKVCAPGERVLKPTPIQTGQLLESWTQGLMWFAWDYSAMVELTTSESSQGNRALRLNFDLAQYPWPVLVLPFGSPGKFEDCRSVSLDVYVPAEMKTRLQLAFAAQSRAKHESRPVPLKPGWNTVDTRIDDSWFPASERRAVREMEWSISGEDQRASGYVVVDNFKIQRANRGGAADWQLLEGWERPLLWRVHDETVRAEINPDQKTGLVLHIDSAKCRAPIVFAHLNPAWDLRKTKCLSLKTELPEAPTEPLAISLVLRANDTEFAGQSKPLVRGKNEVLFDLDESWLPETVRGAVDQIGFRLLTRQSTGQWDLKLQTLEAGGGG